jgi:GINS complex subunit 4
MDFADTERGQEQQRERERERDEQAAVAAIIDDFEQQFHETLPQQSNLNDNAQAEDVLLLQQAWVREKTVPVILPHEDALVGRILNRVRRQLEFIESNSVTLQTHEKDIKLQLVLIESELERVQFLLRSYIRHRLRKLDKYALYVQDNTQEKEKLSSDEVIYLEGHLAMVHSLLSAQFLGKMEGTHENLGEDSAMVEPPPEDAHVFLQVVEPVQTKVEGTLLELRPGEVHVMRYALVAQFVASGAVEII